MHASVPVASGQLICLDQEQERIGRQPESDPESGVMAENLAYVIYTSGSTGVSASAAVKRCFASANRPSPMRERPINEYAGGNCHPVARAEDTSVSAD